MIITVRINTISRGKIAIFNICPNRLRRPPSAAVVSSFWISNAISTRMTINDNEPAIVAVVKIEIELGVIVVITAFPFAIKLKAIP